MQWLQTESEEIKAELTDTASPRSGHDFSRVAIRPTEAGAIQTKLAINKPGDEYEQEADYVAEHVMRMPEPQPQRACACGGKCSECRAQQAMTIPASTTLKVLHRTVERAQARPELLETPVLDAQAIPAIAPEVSVQPELTIGKQAKLPSLIQRQTESLADQGDCSGWERDCESFCIRAAKQYWLDVDGVQPPAVKRVDCSTPLFGPNGEPRLGPCIVSFEGGLRVSVGRPLDKSAKTLEIWRTRTGSTRGYAGPSCEYEYHCATKGNSLIVTQVSCQEYQPQLPKQEQEESKILSPVQRQPADRSSLQHVPPIVDEVLNSPGQPLDSATSAFMESRFGHDFSQVRVHTDSYAARSAKAIDARAYTVGRNIVFGAGQFQPATQRGRKLLAHELTHVVQQRRLPVPVARHLGVVGNFHERQPSAVGDALMRGGDIAGLLGSGSGPAPSLQRDTPQAGAPSPAQPTTASTPASRPLDYDRATLPRPLPLPPKGYTAADVTKLLSDIIKSGKIAGFALKGVRSGSDAETFLLLVIYQLGTKSRWGTETDIVTAIGWPVKPNDPPPQGLVTLRIDPQGVATAELVAAGPVPAVAQTTVAAGSARLIADFGFASVTGWKNTPKDADEISDVLGAMALLRARAPQDIPALKGVDLIRVPSLGGETAGEFSVGGTVAQGATTASKPSLKLADRAFSADDLQFFGGGPTAPPVPSSFQVILHEVGHAVEREELRLAQEAYVKAAAERGAAQQRLKDYDATYDADYKEAKSQRKLGKFYRRREAEHKKLEAAVDRASAHAIAEHEKIENTLVPSSTVQPFETEAAAMGTSAANSLNAAKSMVQTLRPDEVQSSVAYVKAIEDTAAAITSFAVDAKAGREAIDDLELVVFQKVFARDRARFELFRPQPPRGLTHRAIFPLEPAVQAQDAWFEAERVLARSRQRTRRVQKFIDLVTANNIRRFTQYSVQNWQLKPGEFYAEAYSLWLVDPEFLKNNYKVVYDFFQSGDYRR